MSLINRKMQFKAWKLPFALHFSSSRRILIQLHLIALLSLLSLCRRFDVYIVKMVVKSETILKRSRCSAFPRTLRLVFVCLWEGDNQKGRLKKQAYLISSASDSAEWDRKVCAVQELLLQIVALSSARVYLLYGGGLEKWQGKRLSFWEDCLRIGKLLWCFLHCTGYRRLMWNFAANKSGQRGKSQRERPAAGWRRRRVGRGVCVCDRNAS